MKQFLQENRTFIVLAAVITILALFKVGNANAYELRGFKTGMTLSEAKQLDLNQMNGIGEYKATPYLTCSDEDKSTLRMFVTGYGFDAKNSVICSAVIDNGRQFFTTDTLFVQVGENGFTPRFIFYKDGDKEPILAAIDAEGIEPDTFDSIATALKKKHGVAPKATGALQNGFGARFTQQEIYINNSTGYISVTKYGTNGNLRGFLRYADTKAWNALMAAKKKTQKNDL